MDEARKYTPLVYVKEWSNDDLSLAHLQERIASASGSVDVLVHPNFQRAGNNFIGTIGFEPSQQYIEAREEYIKSILSAKRPFIVLEQSEKVSEIASLMPPGIMGDVIYLRTRPMSPRLIDGSESYIQSLIGLGVKKATFSGCLLSWYPPKSRYPVEIEGPTTADEGMRIIQNYIKNLPPDIRMNSAAQAWVKKGYIPQQCVGFAALMFLKHGIDVDFNEQACSIEFDFRK